MTDKKEPNYSKELTAKVVTDYQAAEDSDEARQAALEAISAETGKTVKSLRAKLVREKVYVAKTYKKKTGGKPETKGTIVIAIAKILHVTEDQLAGLENATKPTLELIRSQFQAAVAALADAETSGE